MVAADMGSLRSVRAAATRILVTEPRLDVLIDNAGAIFPERTVGPDGIESTLATLVVGPFTLEAALLKATQDLEHQVQARQLRRLERGKSQLQLSAISGRWTHAQAGQRA